MSAQKWMYAVVVAVSIVAGLLIAGGPSSLRSRQPAASAIARTTTAESVTASTTDSTSLVTAPGTITPDPTSGSSTTSTAAPSTVAPSSNPSDGASVTTTSSVAGGGTATGLPLREQLVVGVANGSGYPGLAGRTAAALAELGYADPQAIDADRVSATTVHFADGLDAAAARLAVDAGFAPTAVAPMAEAPGLSVDDEFDLVLVLGADAVPAAD